MTRPIWVYDNWTAYTDGFAGLDETRLTEAFALEHLSHVARAKRLGVRIDYYMMNAFWYEPDGGYRIWRQPDWPDGTPDRWLAGCAEIGVTPALWFGTNMLWKMVAPPEWADSVDPTSDVARYEMGASMSMSDGGFLPDFIAALEHWYDLGVRLFEFDTANFAVGTPGQRARLSADEIRELNIRAFVDALTEFRDARPDVVLAGFNGFGGDIETTSSPVPFKHPFDPRFVELFDSFYTGDLRVSDVPHESFWRSMDLYTDHMIRRFEANDVPLHKTDPLGFVMSTTWFGANRGATALRGQAILTAARGSMKKTLYGDLGLMSDDDARWFARVQEIYTPLLENGTTETFGGMPGDIEPYGFRSSDDGGALSVVVNPTQSVATVPIPGTTDSGRVLFADAGFVPEVVAGAVRLGPGQLALVGTGRYDSADHDLGVEPDVVIPRSIQLLEAEFVPSGPQTSTAAIVAPAGTVRVVCRQFGPDGWAHRTIEFVPETAERLGIEPELRGRSFTIEASQYGRPLPVKRSEIVAEFYGTSWAVAEIPAGSFEPGSPLTISCATRDDGDVTLQINIYTVDS